MCNNSLAHSLSCKFDLSEEEEEIVLVAIPGLHEVGLGRWRQDHNQSVCAGCVRVHAGTSGRGIVWTLDLALHWGWHGAACGGTWRAARRGPLATGCRLPIYVAKDRVMERRLAVPKNSIVFFALACVCK